MNYFQFLVVLAVLSGCGSDPAPATAGQADAAAGLTDAAASETTADAKADSKPNDTAVSAKDATTDGATTDVKVTETAGKTLPTCAQAVSGWVVTGKCSNGGSSIPYACMKAKGCELTWETDYRNWSGPMADGAYHLKNATGTEKIDGAFDSKDSGTYTYEGGSLTCTASIERFISSVTDQTCCDPVGQDCADKTMACVPIADTQDNQEIVTTGCLAMADAPTSTEGAVCKLAPALPCAAGLLCAREFGVTTGADGTCKKLCSAATHCAATQSCVIVGGAPKTGVCSHTCAPFVDAASPLACPAGFGCLAAGVANAKSERELGTLCLLQGSGKLGDACTSSSTCAPSSTCSGNQCKALCDSAHPCQTGACTDFGLPLGPTAPAGFGYCK